MSARGHGLRIVGGPSVHSSRSDVRAVDERVDAFTRWRIARAKEALHRDGSTLASVAREVGYASEFALSVAFRRTVGEPPGRWRERTRPA